MSGDSKKPTITRAGKKPTVSKAATEAKKLSYFDKRRRDKKLKAKKKREEDAKTREEILRKQKKKQKGASPSEVKASVLKASKKDKKAKSKPPITKNQKKASKAKKSTTKAKKKKSHDRKSSERRKIYAVVGVAGLLLLVGLGVAKQNRPENGQVSSDSTASGLLGESDSGEESSKPGFVAINPRTSAGDLRSHYDPDRGFYTFQEELFGKLITVNQQPVPADFVLSADALLNQTEYSTIGSFETEKGTVYVARLESDDYHSVAFTFRELLIFITSTKNITNAQWVEYINSL